VPNLKPNSDIFARAPQRRIDVESTGQAALSVGTETIAVLVEFVPELAPTTCGSAVEEEVVVRTVADVPGAGIDARRYVRAIDEHVVVRGVLAQNRNCTCRCHITGCY
jgi:hypothetical protein